MLKGRVVIKIDNTVLDHTFVLAEVGEIVYIHEDHGHAFEVSTEKNPSMTFYATKHQVEVING